MYNTLDKPRRHQVVIVVKIICLIISLCIFYAVGHKYGYLINGKEFTILSNSIFVTTISGFIVSIIFVWLAMLAVAIVLAVIYACCTLIRKTRER